MTYFVQFKLSYDQEENNDIRDFFKNNKIIKWELIEAPSFSFPILCVESATNVTEGSS